MGEFTSLGKVYTYTDKTLLLLLSSITTKNDEHSIIMSDKKQDSANMNEKELSDLLDCKYFIRKVDELESTNILFTLAVSEQFSKLQRPGANTKDEKESPKEKEGHQKDVPKEFPPLFDGDEEFKENWSNLMKAVGEPCK